MEELRSHPRAAQRLATAGSCYHPGEEEEGGGGVTELESPSGSGNHDGYTHWEQEP